MLQACVTPPYSVCIIGVGELGTRIAGELSSFGIKVNVYDKDVKKLNNVKYEISLQRDELIRKDLSMATDEYSEVETFTNIVEALQDIDFVFEAIVDNMEIKQSLFEEITHHCKSDTVVCSNTLQLNVEEIAENSLFQNRVVGCRFMMPVYRIPLVEVMYTSKTSSDVIDKVTTFFKTTKKRLLVRQFDENPKLLTISETKHFWKEAKLSVEERRSKMNEKRTQISHGATTGIPKTLDCDCEACGEVQAEELPTSELEWEYEACQNRSTRYHGQTENLSTNEGRLQDPLERTIDDEISIEEEGGSLQSTADSGTDGIESQQMNCSNNEDGDKEDGCGNDIPNECVLCNDAQINCVLVPCGHMWLCFECGKAVQKSGKGCPACRRSISQIVRAFLP